MDRSPEKFSIKSSSDGRVIVEKTWLLMASETDSYRGNRRGAQST